MAVINSPCADLPHTAYIRDRPDPEARYEQLDSGYAGTASRANKMTVEQHAVQADLARCKQCRANTGFDAAVVHCSPSQGVYSQQWRAR
jgi:hypothetical protein